MQVCLLVVRYSNAPISIRFVYTKAKSIMEHSDIGSDIYETVLVVSISNPMMEMMI